MKYCSIFEVILKFIIVLHVNEFSLPTRWRELALNSEVQLKWGKLALASHLAQ